MGIVLKHLIFALASADFIMCNALMRAERSGMDSLELKSDSQEWSFNSGILAQENTMGPHEINDQEWSFNSGSLGQAHAKESQESDPAIKENPATGANESSGEAKEKSKSKEGSGENAELDNKSISGEAKDKRQLEETNGEYNDNGSPVETSNVPEGAQNCATQKLLDVAFVIDESGSIGRSNFEKIKQFVSELVDSFDVDNGQVRIATLKYSSSNTIVHHFNQFNTGAAIKKEILDMNYLGGYTATGEALKETNAVVLKEAQGMRKNALQVVVVVADGVTNMGEKPEIPAKTLIASGSLVFAVGIKGAPIKELLSIAQSPDRVFEISDFDKLDGEIQSQISKTVCKEAENAPAPQPEDGKCGTTKLLDMIFVIDESWSVGHSNFEKMKVFISDLVDTFDVNSGQVRIATMKYGSLHNINIIHKLNEFNNETQVKQAIIGLGYRGGQTATGRALEVCKSEVFQVSAGLRPNALKIVVVFTDGNTNQDPKPGAPAEALINEGAIIFAVGIKGASRQELLSIAQNPNRVIEIEDFDKLGAQIKDSISAIVCEEAENEQPSLPTQNDALDHPSVFEEGKCNSAKKLDLLFVIDESGSIGFGNYNKIKEFIQKLIDSFDVDSGQTQIGVLRYSGIINKGFFIVNYLNEFNTADPIKSAISSMPYSAGATATGEALKYAKKHMLIPSKGLRPDALKSIIVVTDGNTNDGEKPEVQAKEFVNQGILMFAVGIKGASENELLSIAQDQKRVFNIKEFDDLSDQLHC